MNHYIKLQANRHIDNLKELIKFFDPSSGEARAINNSIAVDYLGNAIDFIQELLEEIG